MGTRRNDGGGRRGRTKHQAQTRHAPLQHAAGTEKRRDKGRQALGLAKGKAARKASRQDKGPGQRTDQTQKRAAERHWDMHLRGTGWRLADSRNTEKHAERTGTEDKKDTAEQNGGKEKKGRQTQKHRETHADTAGQQVEKRKKSTDEKQQRTQARKEETHKEIQNIARNREKRGKVEKQARKQQQKHAQRRHLERRGQEQGRLKHNFCRCTKKGRQDETHNDNEARKVRIKRHAKKMSNKTTQRGRKPLKEDKRQKSENKKSETKTKKDWKTRKAGIKKRQS
ncbi:hypothetical protein, conserved [Trypanosoma vivax Y486]|uniref:Uncharacterized protein n=1 Tax=Trypanosoma vivax (strain Y486) TaxID=1055687 RepID=F9WKM8_TRYVY|nr:hypothetical protein, conserved [Trypanosoma vivax Y486]|eukprot:CCD18050.1 hypothetical protein, conserved [Trypanosoma vivax Y486]